MFIQAASQGVADGCAVSDTRNALTMQDLEALRRGRSLPMYDAMIIHGEEEADARFAWDLADRIEKAGKTVFLPERDLIAGTIEHSASVDIICERCDKVVTLFSPSFMESPKNKLYTDLAQYKSLEKKTPVLIPVMLKGW